MYLFFVSVAGLQSAPYPLVRNKSDGHILKAGGHPVAGLSRQQYDNDPNEAGYVSDVCDYNLRQSAATQLFLPEQPLNRREDRSHQDDGVIHGKLSLSIAADGPPSVDSAGVPPMTSQSWSRVSPSVKPHSPALEAALSDRRQELIQKRAAVFQQQPPAAAVGSLAFTAPATSSAVERRSSGSSFDNYKGPNNRRTNPQQEIALASADETVTKPLFATNHHHYPLELLPTTTTTAADRPQLELSFRQPTDSHAPHASSSPFQNVGSSSGPGPSADNDNIDNDDNYEDDDMAHAQTAIFQILQPAHSRSQQQQQQQQYSEEEPDSQLSRQSSVEEGGGVRARRRSSGGKSSAIKSRIQMRRMMKEANRLEVPAGGHLSDADQDNNNNEDAESVEEKQDSESVLDEEIRNSKKKKKMAENGNSQPYAVAAPGPSKLNAQLTPETARRMRDWNSRFYNLKNSFDTTSDKEEDASRSPSVHRHLPEFHLHQQEVGSATGDEGGDRGRTRFKDKGPVGQKRAQSAHGSLLTRGGAGAGGGARPNIVVDQSPSLERPQSKDDKNKNNAIIANNNNINARMFAEATTPKARHELYYDSFPCI